MPFWRSKPNKNYKEAELEATNVPSGQSEPELDVVDNAASKPDVPKTQWIWVEGYKAVYADMTTKKGDIVYEIGKTYEMPAEEVEECKAGYHLCRRLKDTFSYYSPYEESQKDIKYYKVKALVPKDKWNDLPEKDTDICKTKSVSIGLYGHIRNVDIDKVAACAICFLEEIDINIILQAIAIQYPTNYLAKYFDLAKEFYLSHDFNYNNAKAFYAYILTNKCGFSEEMSNYLVNKDLMQTALAFGTQPELTVKEKLQFIFNQIN